ncbi:nucleotidyltransferase family protein [Tenacibaculum insulae]|uniref:nucleotidyltransferase family protein n=1 Tax=Tenacibaculum insulae TaxID=2029677 RepID=UPI003AB3DCDC
MKPNLTLELIEIIKNDEWMLNILKTVRSLNLPDCWIGAGFIRNKVWDYKHHKTRTSLNDIDLIYFNAKNCSPKIDILLEQKLNNINSTVNWSVKNQARMHIRNKQPHYNNCYHAVSFWPETATAIAVKLNIDNTFQIIAPHGLEDLFNLIVKPTPHFDLEIYHKRIKNKSWQNNWPKLHIFYA